MTFDESKYRRDGGGRFTSKGYEEADDVEIDADDVEVVDEPADPIETTRSMFHAWYPENGDVHEHVREHLGGLPCTDADVDRLAEAYEAYDVANMHTEGGDSVIPDEETARDEADFDWQTGAYNRHPYDTLEGSPECVEELRLQGATARRLLDAYPPGEGQERERELLTRLAESPEDTPLDLAGSHWESLEDYAFTSANTHITEIANRPKDGE